MSTFDPWVSDACSLVEAFRRGERDPREELEATLTAIDASDLNAMSYVDHDAAREAAAAADVTLPFGGIPYGVKELTDVARWPSTHGSLVFRDRRASVDAVAVARMRAAGAVIVGMTTASEFGGVNWTRTRLNGTTYNPWDRARTPGGSSGGSAAAVSGGLMTLASAGDGGGSIRIPGAFTGLPGLKTTYGRIPRAPGTPSDRSRR